MLSTLSIVILVAGVGVLVLLPMIAGGSAARAASGGGTDLLLRRDQLFHDIRETEFDYRVGKLSEDDYSRSVGQLKAEAADVIELIEGSSGRSRSAAVEAGPADAEARIAAARRRVASRSSEEPETKCPNCETPNPSHARFCMKCGLQLIAETEDEG